MKFELEDKFLLMGIECKVVFINSLGHALLVPEEDSDDRKLLTGVVFDRLDQKGRSKDGYKAFSIIKTDCCAV